MGDLIERLRTTKFLSLRNQFALQVEAADELTALRERVAALRTYARDISKAITGLSAGAGSEWFKPVGDDHFVDPAFAAERLSSMLADGRDAKRQLIRERRAAHLLTPERDNG